MPPARNTSNLVLVVDSAGNTILGGQDDTPHVQSCQVGGRPRLLVQPCLLHHHSPSTLGFYAVLDAWKFSGESEGQYALGLSAISSAWRSPRDAKMIYSQRCQSFQRTGCKRRREGRCLAEFFQTRWGSMNDIEKIVWAGHLYLASHSRMSRTYRGL